MSLEKTSSLARGLAAAAFAALALGACGDAGMTAAGPAPRPAAQDMASFLEAMKPARPGKPVIAILAHNANTETTDFLLPHALLKRSGVAEVQAVAVRRGQVNMYPALQIEVEQDLADFDRAHAAGADYVIVPALDDVDDPSVNLWLRQQAAKGARVISVCAGALILGRAGLIEGKRFTTHWHYRKDALQREPTAVFVRDRRYVSDGRIGSTAGISASMPAMLALVEAIGGTEKARQLADELGIAAWTPAHDSAAFGLNAERAARYLWTKASFWRNERWAIEVRDGMDDIALALTADAWTRTGHVRIHVSGTRPVRLASGIRLLVEPAADAKPFELGSPALKSALHLDRTLCAISDRFGPERSEWVRMELEYPGPAACPG